LADISVSIISNDNRELVLSCLDSIFKTAAGMDIEVIVIENHSADGSAQAIRGRFPSLRLIENEKKEGFSANHNKALKVAAGEYVLILNDDTVLHEGALAAMLKFMRANPGAGAVGGMLLNPDGSPQYTGKDRPTVAAALMISLGLHRLFPGNPVTSRYFLRKGGYGEVEEVESLNGAAMMIRREAFIKVGPFDEKFFLFCEDVDYSIRLKEAGYRLYFLPGAKITHYRGASTGGRRIVWIYHRSLFHFYRKHYARGRFFLFNWAVYAGITMRLMVFLVYGNVRRRGGGAYGRG